MDPSPFSEKDLDRNAEEFILNWTQEFPAQDPVALVVHLKKLPEVRNVKGLVSESIHHYFAYRVKLNRMEFHRLMRQGRTSLLVGLVFLGLCLIFSDLLLVDQTELMPNFLQQGLTIVGWVAMWRPLEIYLYEWWPIVRRGKLFEKLSRMPIEVKKG